MKINEIVKLCKENGKREKYGAEVDRDFPLVKYVFPYKDPLYAIIEITDSEIIVTGRESEIVDIQPSEVNFKKEGLVDKVEAIIRSRRIRRKI